MESALMAGDTAPTGQDGVMCTPDPLDILYLPISCPEVETGDSRRGNGQCAVHLPGPLDKDALLSFFHAQRCLFVPNY